MRAPLLSICIPTFNRKADLQECLESLRMNWVPHLEIVISDNASTDTTIEMLAEFAKVLPLRWQQQPENVGPDQNFVDVIAMAKGDYCWILGSDDSITPDSLRFAVNQICIHRPDIFHFGYIQGDKSLRPLSRFELSNSAVPVVMNSDSAANYIGSLKNLSLAFLFVSCFMFKRCNWVAQINRIPALIGSNYVHAYMIHAMIAAGASVLSTDNCMVIARPSSNEFSGIPGKLLRLDATTLTRIHNEINCDAAYFEALGRVFRRTYPIYIIIVIAAYGGLPNLYTCRSEFVGLGYSTKIFNFLHILDRLGILPYLFKFSKFRRSILNFFS